ncbi:MAG TPA: hypothetical protein VFM11_06880, partial [Burkholderiales bacterium]|nr:hypothetical protein [Burkholderiales bacterium]
NRIVRLTGAADDRDALADAGRKATQAGSQEAPRTHRKAGEEIEKSERSKSRRGRSEKYAGVA